MTMGDGTPFSFHGEQIAVTTLTMARLQEALLTGPAPALQQSRLELSDFERRFGAETGRSCWREFQKKRLDRERCAALNQRLENTWAEMAAEIEQFGELLTALGSTDLRTLELTSTIVAFLDADERSPLRVHG